MEYGSKAAGMAVFIGMVMAGSFAQAAAGTVSTVDSQELFRSRMVVDNKAPKGPDTAQAVDNAVANLPELNSRLRWAAVKTSAELAEEKKAAQRQNKAIPIIITAADIDKERKAQKRGEKPSLITPRPVQPPKITSTPAPAPVAKPAAVQPVQPLPRPVVSADVVELPPIQPISSVVRTIKPEETVELPPIMPAVQPQKTVPVETIMEAVVESTSIELVIHDVADENHVELPAVQPVR